MRELQHNEVFSGANESRSLVLVTGGAAILRLNAGGFTTATATVTPVL